MANGWNSYYHNLPPLPSDTEMSRRMPDTDATLLQHAENYIGQDDISSTVTFPDPPEPTSNVNVNFSPNPDCEKTDSLYGYQEYFNDTQWDEKGEQNDNLCLQRCANSPVSEFSDELKKSKTYLPSCTGQFQGEKLNCEKQAPSIENYADVSSYPEYISDSDPSYYVASNLIPRLGSERPVEPGPSEWLTPIEENNFQDLKQNIAQTNVMLLSNTKSTMDFTEKNKENPEIKPNSSRSCFSSFSSVTTITESDAIHIENEYSNQQGQRLKENDVKIVSPGSYSCSPVGDCEKSQEKQIKMVKELTEEIAKPIPSLFKQEDFKHPLNNTQSKELQAECSHKEGTHLFTHKNRELKCSNFTQDNNRCWSERKQKENNPTKIKERYLADEETALASSEFKCVQEKFSVNSFKTSDRPNGSHQQVVKIKENAESDVSQSLSDTQIGDCENTQKEILKLEKVLSKEIGANDTDDSFPQIEAGKSFFLQDEELESLNLKEQDDRFSSEKEPEKNNPADKHKVENVLKKITSITNQAQIFNSFTCQSEKFVDNCLEKEISVNLFKFSSPVSLEEATLKENTEEKVDFSCKMDSNNLDNSNISDSFSESIFETNFLNKDPPKNQDDPWSSCTMGTDGDHSEQSDNNSQDATKKNVCEDAKKRDEAGSKESSMLSYNPSSISLSRPDYDAATVNQCSTTYSLLQNSSPGEESARGPFHTINIPVPGTLSSESPPKQGSLTRDTSETNVIPSPSKEMFTAGHEVDQKVTLKNQESQIKCSVQMKKTMHPVVILKTLESIEVNKSYQCANCHYPTNNVDLLIEHHHSCCSMEYFQFCKTCHLFQLKKEPTENHSCSVKMQGLESSFSKQNGKKMKIRRNQMVRTPFECKMCGQFYASSCTLWRHKNVPGRCKKYKLPVTSSPSTNVTSSSTDGDMPASYVNLVDIFQTKKCVQCGERFSDARSLNKHYLIVHNLDTVSVSSKPPNKKLSDPKFQPIQKDVLGEHKCLLCPRLFKYPFNRNRHLRDCVRETIYGGKMRVNARYCCPLCHSTFSTSQSRTRHIKLVCLKKSCNRLAKGKMTKKQPDKEKKKTLTKHKELKTQHLPDGKENSAQQTSPPNALVRQYKCKLCPAVFYHSSGKYRHMKKHELFKLTGKTFRYRNPCLPPRSIKQACSTKTEASESGPESTEAPSELFNCQFCGKGFNSLKYKNTHERIHRGERPFQCLECGKGFKNRHHLKSHKSIHQRRIQCTVCRKIVSSISDLIQHRKLHPKRGMLNCPDCPMQFQYPAYLLRHVELHKKIEDKALQIKQVEKSKSQEFKKPLQKDDTAHLQCTICKDIFDDAQVLLKHCLTHISGSSLNKCPFCKKKFKSRPTLECHMIKHTDKALSYTNSGKQVCRQLSPNPHSKESLASSISFSRKRYSCKLCPRKFARSDRLKRHHLGHSRNTLQQCSNCEQFIGFTQIKPHESACKKKAKDHITLSPTEEVTSQTSQDTHKVQLKKKATNLLPLQCSYCTETFKYRSLLMRHLVIHTGVQPYPCMRCGNRYGSQSTCLKHEAFCTGDKNEELSKSHSDSEKLKQPHLGEASQGTQMDKKNELKCKFCTKTFGKSRSLRRHILTHNEVKPYRCKACDSCFSRYDHLKVHQTHCKGRKKCLEIRIPKVNLEDIGKGWQKRFGFVTGENKRFQCTNCDSVFTHEKTLKRHRKLMICRRSTYQKKAALPLEIEHSTKMEEKRPIVTKSRLLKRIQPCLTNNRKFQCSYCPRSFPKNWQLKCHTRLHTGEKPFGCNYCGENFARRDYLNRHTTKCTMVQNILCDQCGEQFPLSKIENHKKKCRKLLTTISTVGELPETSKESKIKGFSCAYCSSKFLLFSQLQEHFMSAHKMETVETSGSSAPLQHHLSRITKEGDESENERLQKGLGERANLICNLDFAFNSAVSTVPTYWCSRCKISFPSKLELTAHKAIHPSKPPLNCKHCSKGFWKKVPLRKHIKNCRKISMKVEMSQDSKAVAETDSVLVFKEGSDSTGSGVLQTNFSCKDGVTDQISPKIEETQMPSSSNTRREVHYQCSECDMSFTDGLLLISHLEDHGRLEQARISNICTQCGHRCPNKASLLRHLKTHGNAKQLSSHEGPKNDYKPSELETHRTLDDTASSFCCKICNKTYTTQKSLLRHCKNSHQKEAKELNNIEKQNINCKQQSSIQVQISEESDENVTSEDSDSDTAPYFPCHVCGKTFTTSENLEDHRLCHLGKKPFECAECGKCFFLASQLQQHQRIHKSEYQCQICGRGFVSFFALRKHKHTHGKSRPHRCSKCHLSFNCLSQLLEHKSTHKDDNFPCDICDRAFLSKSLRDEHRKSHANASHHATQTHSSSQRKQNPSIVDKSLVVKSVPKYRCGVCCVRFEDPEGLSEHGCLKANERPYSCTDCDKHFLHLSHLLKHKTTHLPSLSTTEYLCNQCKVSYSSSQDFLNHMKSHVEIDKNIKHESDDEGVGPLPTFLCPVCHQCFTSAAEVIPHFSTHLKHDYESRKPKLLDKNKGQNPTTSVKYKCSRCNLNFSGNHLPHRCSHQQEAALHSAVAHSTVEEEVDVTGDDSYSCLPCSLKFSSKSGLLDHQNKQHVAENRFKCEICGRSFSRRSYLKKHRQRHEQIGSELKSSQTMKFKCTRCSSSFSALNELTLHMRLHAEEEVGMYRCDMCYKSFSQFSQLRKHQESHVGEVVYECPDCDKAFAFPHLLEEHQQNHGTSSQ